MPSPQLSFIHLSDLHFQAEGAQPFLSLDTAQKARDVIATVRKLDVNPAFIVISGDLAHDGEPGSYIRFKDFLTELGDFGVPVLLGLGNHDRRVAFRQVVLGEDNSDEATPYFYSQMIGDIRVIVLDSKVPEQVHGEISQDQLDWLTNQLATPASGGNIVVFHHPPLPTALPALESHLLSNQQALADVLAGQSVRCILNGHVHFPNIGSFNGIACAAATGTAFTLDPSAQEGLRFFNGSGFNLVHLLNGQTIINPITVLHTDTTLLHYKPGQTSLS